MKKIIILIALLLVPSLLFAGMTVSGRPCPGGGAAACTTPDNGDELDEGFLGSGYQVAGWTEVIGAGGTVDEDFTLSGTPPTSSCSEGLNIIASEANTYVYWDRGSGIDSSTTNFSVTFDIYFDSVTIGVWTNFPVFRPSGSTAVGTAGNYYLKFYSNNGTPQLLIEATDAGGASDSTAVTISMDTWYTITIYHDAGTPANSYFQLVGGGLTTCDVAGECTFGSTVGIDPRYFFFGGCYAIGAGESVDMEIGYVSINTP